MLSRIDAQRGIFMEEAKNLADQPKSIVEKSEITNEQIYMQVLKARQLNHWEPILNLATFFGVVSIAYIGLAFATEGATALVFGIGAIVLGFFGICLMFISWPRWYPLWKASGDEIERLLKDAF
jgi:hypothetical protein